MKIFPYAVTILLGIIHVSCADSLVYANLPLSSSEEFDEVYDICFDESGVPEEDRYFWRASDPRFKCFNACVYTRTGLMEDGKLLPTEFFVKLSDILADLNEPGKNRLIRGIRECTDTANQYEDPCDVAYSMAQCI